MLVQEWTSKFCVFYNLQTTKSDEVLRQVPMNSMHFVKDNHKEGTPDLHFLLDALTTPPDWQSQIQQDRNMDHCGMRVGGFWGALYMLHLMKPRVFLTSLLRLNFLRSKITALVSALIRNWSITYQLV